MSEMFWLGIAGLVVSTGSIIATVLVSTRNMAAQHKRESDKLSTEMHERVAVLETKIMGFAERVSTFERHIQKQIDDLKIRMMELEKEVRREKSVR